jgi:hypothetical protein
VKSDASDDDGWIEVSEADLEPDPPPSLEEAARAARGHFVGVAIDLVKKAIEFQSVADELVTSAEMVTELAELPAEDVVRARLNPELFKGEA